MRRSEDMARAIANIRAGNTRGQKNQAFMDRAILTGATATIGAMGHAAEGAESKRMQEDRADEASKRGIMERAISQQTARAGNEARIGKESEQYASADYTGNPETDGRPVPQWLKDDQGASQTPYAIPEQASGALASQRLNSSAGDAQFGGYNTAVGLANSADAEGKLTRDIARAKGGMMGSLDRVPR